MTAEQTQIEKAHRLATRAGVSFTYAWFAMQGRTHRNRVPVGIVAKLEDAHRALYDCPLPGNEPYKAPPHEER